MMSADVLVPVHVKLSEDTIFDSHTDIYFWLLMSANICFSFQLEQVDGVLQSASEISRDVTTVYESEFSMASFTYKLT